MSRRSNKARYKFGVTASRLGHQICKGQPHRRPGNNDWSIQNEIASNLASFWTIFIQSKAGEFRETFTLFYFSQKTNQRYKRASATTAIKMKP